MGLIAWLIIGLIVGWLAGQWMKSGSFEVLGDIILGIVGALVGGYLASVVLNIANPVNVLDIASLIVAIIGAIILVAVVRAVTGRSTVQ